MAFVIHQRIERHAANPPLRYQQDMELGDRYGHEWRVAVFDQGQPADLTGCSVSAFFRRGDGNTVPLSSGTVEGNEAVIVLAPGCYNAEGWMDGVMRITLGEEKIAVAQLSARVVRHDSDAVVDPEHIVPDVSDLIAMAEEIDAAAELVEGLTVSASEASGSTPTAAVSTVDDHYHIDFGLVPGPQGQTGPTGAVPNIAVGTVETGAAGSSASVTRRSGSPDTAPVFDFSIPKGDKGDTGDTGQTGQTGPAGTGVASVVVSYQAGSSATTPPSGTWLDNPPAGSQGEYLWTRTVTTLTDTPATVVTAYSVAYQGTDGSGSVQTVDNISPVSGNITLPNMSGASALEAGAAGKVPAPAAGDEGKFLRGDASWQDVPNPATMTGATASTAGTGGLVPAPAAGDQNKLLAGDGTWHRTCDIVRISVASGDWQSGQSWPDNVKPIGLSNSTSCYLATITADLDNNPIVSSKGDEFALIDYKQENCPADLYVYVGNNCLYVATTETVSNSIAIRGVILHRCNDSTSTVALPTRLVRKVHLDSDYFNSGEQFNLGTNKWYIGFEGTTGNAGAFCITMPKKPRSGMSYSHNLSTSLIRCNGYDASNPAIDSIGITENILTVNFKHSTNSTFAKMPAAVQLTGKITFT